MKFVNYEYLGKSALRLVSYCKLVKGLANSHAVRTLIFKFSNEIFICVP